ncbi:hypothetical protein GCM10010517_03430 [Streptosporangium fragile]|uniref:Uncharacterized protein n=1 Tax=Streptosporangium fragile TaxID=46186 RepID=A0ABP6I685_9ACTN
MSTDTDRRTAFITGLRDLAAFLEANPELPAPKASTLVTYFPDHATDAEMCAEIDRIAALCGTGIDADFLPYGHYVTTLSFGPVRYEATAILADARARHDALMSYHGCVTPDTNQTTAA